VHTAAAATVLFPFPFLSDVNRGDILGECPHFTVLTVPTFRPVLGTKNNEIESGISFIWLCRNYKKGTVFIPVVGNNICKTLFRVSQASNIILDATKFLLIEVCPI
jgi:hypothetical protein